MLSIAKLKSVLLVLPGSVHTVFMGLLLCAGSRY